jgi:hypothetical protein
MPDEREELLEALRELAALYPSMRFGQVVEAAAVWAGTNRPKTVGEVTDLELLRAAREHVARRRGDNPARQTA